MKQAEQEYIDVNHDNQAEQAYAVNNNQLSVRDLLPDFDVSLLNDENQKKFADVWGKKETTKTATKPTATTETLK